MRGARYEVWGGTLRLPSWEGEGWVKKKDKSKSWKSPFEGGRGMLKY